MGYLDRDALVAALNELLEAERAGAKVAARNAVARAEFDAKLKALTVDDVNAAIRKHIKPEAISVFAAGDFAKVAKGATGAVK